jgi:hypothetical protein
VRSLLAPLGLLVGACFLAVAVRSSSADGGGPFLPGGGDAIGSLPKQFLPGGPEGGGQGLQAQKPSIVLEGPDLESIETLVVDAFGQGHAEVFAPDALGRVRVELQGRVTVVLDRARLHTLGVSVRLDVSQGFSSGLGIFSQGSRTSGIQALPAQGDLSLPLVQLEQAGVLDAGPVVLHSVSLQSTHHILEMSGSGGTLRLSSRD